MIKKPYYTTREVAKIFQVSYECIRKIRTNSDISYNHPFKMICGKDYIRKEFRKTLWTYRGVQKLYERFKRDKKSKWYEK